MDKEIIYQWDIPEDYPSFTRHDDVPQAYRIRRWDDATGGLIVEARYDDKWIANPWSTRPLVRHFLVYFHL